MANGTGTYRNPLINPYGSPVFAPPAPAPGPAGNQTAPPIYEKTYAFEGSGPLAGMNVNTLRPRGNRMNRLARREIYQGNAALLAANALYDPTLALARQSAADYGDIYREEARKALEDELIGQTRRREQELADFASLSPEYIAQLRKDNPLLGELYDQARSEFAMGSSLNPVEARQVEEYVRRGQATRGMGLGPADVFQEALEKSEFGQALKERRRVNATAASGLFGDVFSAVTGRTGGSGTPMGSTIQAPQYGTNMDDFLSIGVNREQLQKNIQAAKDAGNKALWGSVIEATGTAIGGIGAGRCWVARAVFGEHNPKWRVFRVWLLTRAPERFRQWYLKHGKRFARKLKNPHRANTRAKLRVWMEGKIEELQTRRHGDAETRSMSYGY